MVADMGGGVDDSGWAVAVDARVGMIFWRFLRRADCWNILFLRLTCSKTQGRWLGLFLFKRFMVIDNHLIHGLNQRVRVPDNYNAELYNSGSFIASDFIGVYTAVAELTSTEGQNYEGLGISPDVLNCHPDNTRDLQLEADINL